MAVSQSDINFIQQNWPQAASIPVNEIRNLASQLEVSFSDSMTSLLTQGKSIDVEQLRHQAAVDNVEGSIDIGDIPLDLGFERPEPAPQPAVDVPLAPEIDLDLAQYDNYFQSGVLDLSNQEPDIDPFDIGIEPEAVSLQPASAENEPEPPQLPPSSEPEALREQILRTPQNVPSQDKAQLLASNPLNGYDAEAELDAIDANDNYGEYHNTLAAWLQHTKYTPTGGLGRYYYSPNRFLKADEMSERLDKFAEIDKSPRTPSEDLDRSQVNAIRFIGKFYANTGDMGEKMDGVIYHKRMWHRPQELFTNRVLAGEPPVLRPVEFNMAATNNPENQPNALAEQQPETALEVDHGPEALPETENSNPEAAQENLASTAVEPKPEEPRAEESFDPEDPAIKAVEEMRLLADAAGNIDNDIAEEILRNHGISPDTAIAYYLREQNEMQSGTVFVQEMFRRATTKAHMTGPSSQPKQTMEPSEEQKAQQDASNTPQGKNSQDNKPGEKTGPAKNDPQNQAAQFTIGGAAMGSVGNIAAKSVAAGAGFAGGIIKGVYGQASGFYKQHQESKRKLGSDIRASIKTLSTQIDSIAQDRQSMKSASNAFERKTIADRMAKKMISFDRTAMRFTETLSNPKAARRIQKEGMQGQLESLGGKVESVFKTMEPGKGEKKAFDNISDSIKSTMESVKALVNAIRNLIPGLKAEGPASPQMQNGPM